MLEAGNDPVGEVFTSLNKMARYIGGRRRRHELYVVCQATEKSKMLIARAANVGEASASSTRRNEIGNLCSAGGKVARNHHHL